MTQQANYIQVDMPNNYQNPFVSQPYGAGVKNINGGCYEMPSTHIEYVPIPQKKIVYMQRPDVGCEVFFWPKDDQISTGTNLPQPAVRGVIIKSETKRVVMASLDKDENLVKHVFELTDYGTYLNKDGKLLNF